jgi:hypothetical protein
MCYVVWGRALDRGAAESEHTRQATKSYLSRKLRFMAIMTACVRSLAAISQARSSCGLHRISEISSLSATTLLASIPMNSLFGAFARSFPKINPTLLRVAINGMQLCIRELEVLDRIE